MKIGHKIIAVPERLDYVNELLVRTSLAMSDVLIDKDHNGCMWNAIRAWKAHKEDLSVTHWCVMADDTDVVDDYMAYEKMCVERFPNAIWTFYSNELGMRHKPNDTPYVKLSSLNIRGIAFLMPVEWIDKYVELCEYMLNTYGYQRDDATCRIYALFNNLPVMTTIPNLVRSHEIKSSMSGHGITHNSDAWQGRTLNYNDFRTFDYEVRHIAKKSARETHLPLDNPIDKKVAEKWKRLNILRRL